MGRKAIVIIEEYDGPYDINNIMPAYWDDEINVGNTFNYQHNL